MPDDDDGLPGLVDSEDDDVVHPARSKIGLPQDDTGPCTSRSSCCNKNCLSTKHMDDELQAEILWTKHHIDSLGTAESNEVLLNQWICT